MIIDSLTTDRSACTVVIVGSSSGGNRLRQSAAWVLVVAFAVVSIASVATGYVRYRLLDTDHYVAAVSSLADEPAIQDYVTTRVTDAIVAQTNLSNRVASALQFASGVVPNALQPAAGAAADAAARRANAQAESTIRGAVAVVVTSAQFRSLWVAANRQAHPHLVDILTGRHSVVQSGDDGRLSVQLAPIVAAVKARLESGGFPYAQYIPAIDRQFVIIESPALRRTQSIVQPIVRAAPVLPWVGLALAMLSVAIAAPGRRLRMLAAVGWSLVAAMAVLTLAIWWGRHEYLRQVAGAVMPKPAARVVFDTLMDPLWTTVGVAAAIGLVVALIAHLVPRSGPLLESVKRRVARRADDPEPADG